MIEQLKDFLIKSQQLNGSFGYTQSEQNIVEPTTFALLALNTYDPKLPQIQAGVKWLLSLQNKDGGWFLFIEDNYSSPYVTALALMTLYRINKTVYSSQIEKGIRYLEKIHSFLSNDDLNPYVWGWNKNCFVGPEPTANIVLALKMLQSKDLFRLQEANKFFLKLTCFDGGWTYTFPVDKNDLKSDTLSCNPLNPELNVTAIVLLAMQDLKTEYSNNLDILLNNYNESFCPFALSLTVLALNCYHQQTSKVLARLNNIMTTDEFVKSNIIYNALTLLANLTAEGKNPLCLTT